MKVLVVKKYNPIVNGVWTFTVDLCNLLVNNNIHVDLWQYDETTEMPPNDYDIIFFHINGMEKAFEKYRGSKRFFVHGLMSEMYVPNNFYDVVYTFGERALNHIQHCDKRLIRNFVDLNKFKPVNNIGHGVLLHSYWNNDNLKQLFSKTKYEYSVSATKKIPKLISKHKIIIAYGRSAIEAFAMGKPTLIYGENGGDGFLDDSTLTKCMETNCSGWSIRNLEAPDKISIEKIENLIDNYKVNSEINRYLAEQYFDGNLYFEKLIS